jgi:hypothetical protein
MMGLSKKLTRHALANHLEKGVSPEERVSEPFASVIDAMGLVQKVDGDKWTFAEISERRLKIALQSHPCSKRVDVVFDVYRETRPSRKQKE